MRQKAIFLKLFAILIVVTLIGSCEKVEDGIEDVYSKTSGRLRTSFNLAKACIDALEKTNEYKGDKK